MAEKKRKEGYPLNQSPFFKLRTKKKLASALGTSVRTLRSFERADRLYTEKDIPKKSGGFRHIENPRRDLKVVQARVARTLGKIVAPNYLFCPVKGRSYVSNAAQHTKNRVIRTLDIKQYFPNTKRDRVYRFFRDILQCNADIAALLTDISTYKGHLPTGSPLSPIMAFYAHFDVWEKVYALSKSNDLIVTLYIDDLTVSGRRVPDHFMWNIKKVIHAAGLRYHKEKVFRDCPAEITGVIIRDGILVAPNRQLLKKYRTEQALARAQEPVQREALATKLKGLRGQIAQIRDLSHNRRAD